MPVSIERRVTISMGGKAEWKVKDHLLLSLGDSQFIRLHASDCTFVRLMCENVIPDGKVPKNASLHMCSGLRELSRLRNQQQRADLLDPGDKKSLFDAKPATTKKVKRARTTLRELRDNPEVLTVQVDGFDDMAPMVVEMIRPVHPNDDISVKLDPDVLHFVFKYIKHRGFDIDTLLAKRVYGTSGSDGIWKQGGGFVAKVPTDGSTRLRRFKTVEEAMQFVKADDADEGINEGGDQETAPEGQNVIAK